MFAHAFIILCFLSLPSYGEPPVRRPLSIDDLYRLDAPTSVVLSPDGKHIAYARQWIDRETKTERHSLWMAEVAPTSLRALEKTEPDARAPVFSPDGKWIAFLSTRPPPRSSWKQTPQVPQYSDPATDIWLISSNGGVAAPLAGPNKPYGRVFNDGFYGRVAFSPDGKRLVFVADDGKNPRTSAELEGGTYVARPDQGEGYTGYGPAQVWIAELEYPQGSFAVKRTYRLTNDDVWYGDPQWSPDGKAIVVHANRTNDRESVRYSINKNYDLWAIDVETHKLRQLTNGPGPEVSPRFSPDGKRIACLSVPRKGSHRDVFNLVIVSLDDEPPTMKVVFDHHGPGADKAPHTPPSFPLPTDCWDGTGDLIIHSEQGTETATLRVDLKSGSGLELEIPGLPTKPPDATTAVGRRKLQRALTPPGNEFLKERTLGKSRHIEWRSTDEMEIDGIVTLPPEGVGKRPYPLIVYPHGGPHSRSVFGFNFTVEIFAAHGYAVLQPNFRGSSGYGQKFIDSDHNELGGGDMRDILTGIAHTATGKSVDPDRQFVYGISYGGFMTCWLVGHTDQFRAAVAQNAVTDMNVMWGLSDIPSWTEWELGGKPWEIPDVYRKHSPITYVDKVKTPTLILHARDDRRCPLPMGQMFHKALEANGCQRALKTSQSGALENQPF